MCSLINNLEQQQREIQDEIPYCRWLYDYVSRILRPQFVVKSREENVPIQFETYEAEQINEYSSSQSDLVIYKAQEGLKSMDCCLISLQASALIAEFFSMTRPVTRCGKVFTTCPLWELTWL